MDKEQQHIAIAEASGYKKAGTYISPLTGKDVQLWFLPDTDITVDDLLDYTEDKNAIAVARNSKWSDVRFGAKYAEELHKICGLVPCGSLNATAEQECEAFLKALNLWTN